MKRKLPSIPPHFRELAEGLAANLAQNVGPKLETAIGLVKAKIADLRPSAPVPRLIPQARATGTTESFDGTPIFWEAHGPAESAKSPIVLCYGLVCSMNQWRYQIERYSADRPVLLVDYRGHHKSGRPEDPKLMNVSAIARDVSAAIGAQGWSKPAHVWGHSMGCNVAIELAASEPGLCASLVLCCGTVNNPFRGMFGAQGLEKLMDPILREYVKHPDFFHVMWRLALAKPELAQVMAGLVGFNEKASRPEDTAAYVKAVATINPNVFFPILIDFSKGMTASIASKTATPALVVAGAEDHVTPPAAQRGLAETLIDAEYMEVPAGSHNVQLDFGEYVCLKAESFWRSKGLD